MEKLNDVKELKHCLIDAVTSAINTHGIYSDQVKAEEIGEIIDMIEDLSEAEMNCMKACYYSTIIEAMDGGHDRPGYDHWRTSSGRFADKGTGHYSRGYSRMMQPPIYMEDMMEGHEGMLDRMGYPSSQTGRTKSYGYISGNAGGRGGSQGREEHPYGTAFEGFDTARRYYYETQDERHRDEMVHYADEHVEETIETMKEIWKDAPLEQKKKIKSHISQLLAEMAM